MNTAPEVLKNRFGHRQFRSRQAEIVATVLAGENALVIMPTGMGKSLCYQVPAIVLAEQARGEEAQSTVTQGNATADSGSGIRQNSSPPVHAKGCLAASTTKAPLTLVISPLIALMKDQVDALIAKGVSAAFVNSSLTRDLREQRYQQIEDGDFDLLYVTPERFRKSEFVTVLAARKIVLLAVDEAHCISEWGHDFRPDYTRVGDIRHQLGCPTTIALTATATPEVQTDIARQLGLELLNDEQVNVDREVEAPAETRAETKREV
jgi:ATP-dependent DNA helicase RecQ